MSEPPIRVLLIEDDEDDYILLRDLLGDLPERRFTLDWASSYEAGREAVRGEGHDVCLLDYRLGERDGLELLREILGEGLRLPVIVITGQGDRATDMEAMRAGAADYLVKGRFDASVLERAIRYAVEHFRTLQALRLSEARYALAARAANDGLWDWDLLSGKVYFSPRWKAMVGAPAGEADDPETWFHRVHPEDLPGVRTDLEYHWEGLTPHFQNEHRMRHADGSWRWMLTRGLAVRDAAGRTVRMAGSQTDITERKAAAEQLIHDAFHDGLTGLPNRALFMDRLAVALARTRRSEDRFAVLLLDLDRFEVVVDSLGHGATDLLLKSLAARLLRRLGPGDTLARPGGDQFLVLLEGLQDHAGATRAAGELQAALAAPFVIEGHEVFTTASIGIVLGGGAYVSPEEVLRDADTAMNRAKAQGRARSILFDAGMHTRAVALLRLETDLRRALERGEFDLSYQPIIALETGRITGYEALLRWRHPDRGVVLPEEFIAVAEETGLIIPLGRWVLASACARMSAWTRASGSGAGLTMNVNLSGVQFAQSDLVEQIGRILEETGLAGRQLGIEITESVVMKDFDAAQALLASLHAREVRLHIDDFGTGYSSLSYLPRFPIDALKIDRSFVSRLGAEGEGEEIVRAIITLAAGLGMEVVAEGVERPEQLERLRKLSCTHAQGFFFARPLAGDAAFALSGVEPWRQNWGEAK
jgi:diguanylate cyclase (GGDEF)-like protein/PAS domain S-box-containing protein